MNIPPPLTQSHTMRNGVLGVIGEALSQALSSPELDEQGRAARDQLLDKLEVSHCSPCLWSHVETNVLSLSDCRSISTTSMLT